MYERGLRQFAGDYSNMWLSNLIMGETEAANAALMPLDQSGDLSGLADFLSYGSFDAGAFPNLLALLQNQGLESREPVTLPYQCGR